MLAPIARCASEFTKISSYFSTFERDQETQHETKILAKAGIAQKQKMTICLDGKVPY